jgi:hypothetical protein
MPIPMRLLAGLVPVRMPVLDVPDFWHRQAMAQVDLLAQHMSALCFCQPLSQVLPADSLAQVQLLVGSVGVDFARWKKQGPAQAQALIGGAGTSRD